MPADLQSLMRLEVPLIVRLAHRKMPLQDVLGLGPGSIIELAKPAGDDLEILVNNKPVGAGRAVKVGENYGIRVTQVGDARQRLAAMQRDRAASRPIQAKAAASAAPASPAAAPTT